MIIFKDILTDDEMLSDAYDMKEVGNGIAYEVDSKQITIKEGDVDIGANASAEEAAEDLEDGMITVNNIVHSFRLASTSFDKKSYLTYLKGYMKAVKQKLQESNPDEVATFEKGAQAFVKETIIPCFKDWEFYTGESMNPDGMVALLNYREDGVTPYVTVWKHGLTEMKV